MVDHGFVYWDACLFTRYLAADEELLDRLTYVLVQAREGKGPKVLTSTLTIAEVAGLVTDSDGKLIRMIDVRVLDDLFGDREVIALAEYHAGVGRRARDLIRDGKSRGLPRLHGADATHFATALVHRAAELHTIDKQVLKQDGKFRYDPENLRSSTLRVCHPPDPLSALPLFNAKTEDPPT